MHQKTNEIELLYRSTLSKTGKWFNEIVKHVSYVGAGRRIFTDLNVSAKVLTLEIYDLESGFRNPNGAHSGSLSKLNVEQINQLKIDSMHQTFNVQRTALESSAVAIEKVDLNDPKIINEINQLKIQYIEAIINLADIFMHRSQWMLQEGFSSKDLKEIKETRKKIKNKLQKIYEQK